jgi:hypothetical protein
MESLRNIEKRLDRIEKLLKKNSEECSKMGKHINFIHEIYTSVRSPLSFMKHKIELLMGTSNREELPCIEPEIK